MNSQLDAERIKNIKGMAFKMFAAKQNCKSIEILEKLVAFAPLDEEIPLLISQNYTDQDMQDDARYALKEGIKRIGKTKRLLYELCLLQKNQKVFQEEFEKNIKALIQADPNDPDSLFLQANLFVEKQKFKEAIEVFKRIHSLDKNSHVSLRSIALCYKNLGSAQEALEFATKSLQVCKEDPLASAIKANAILALNQGGEEEAKKILSQVAIYAQKTITNEPTNSMRLSQTQLLAELLVKSNSQDNEQNK